MFRSEAPLILEIPEFPYNTVGGRQLRGVYDEWKNVFIAQLDSSISVDKTPICDGQTDGQIHGVAR